VHIVFTNTPGSLAIKNYSDKYSLHRKNLGFKNIQKCQECQISKINFNTKIQVSADKNDQKQVQTFPQIHENYQSLASIAFGTAVDKNNKLNTLINANYQSRTAKPQTNFRKQHQYKVYEAHHCRYDFCRIVWWTVKMRLSLAGDVEQNPGLEPVGEGGTKPWSKSR